MLAQILDSLTILASSVYGGTVITFALLLALYPRLSGRSPLQVAMVWRAVGPVLGISMGLWVLGLLAGRYVEVGHMSWGWSTPEAVQDLIHWLVFGVLWLSSFVLEIWTNEPLRTAVSKDTGQITDQAHFDGGYARVRLHLGFNALLVATWLAMAA